MSDRHMFVYSTREKAIMAGLFLAKFDAIGLKVLGFETFLEAFNAIGLALGTKPASIKNYRDEFDPLFPNRRKGWHKRPVRDHCLSVYETLKELDIHTFANLIKSLFALDDDFGEVESAPISIAGTETSFAQRLITELAAERYFEGIFQTIPVFHNYLLENTTAFGCGYDFRLRVDPHDVNFLAVEVKGLKKEKGSVLMTSKEYVVASSLHDRFFLFVVRNFDDSPFHDIYRDPTSSQLNFKKVERTVIQTSWLANL